MGHTELHHNNLTEMRVVKDAISSNMDRKNTGLSKHQECPCGGRAHASGLYALSTVYNRLGVKKPTHRHLVKTLSKMGSYCTGSLARIVRT